LPLWPGEGSGYAEDIFLHHGDIYVAGYVKTNYHYAAYYWKNGERIELDIPNEYTGGLAHAIWVTDKNVYVCGSFFEPNYSRNWLCMWKNGAFERINQYSFDFGDLLVTAGDPPSGEKVYISGTDWVFGQYPEPFVYVDGNYTPLAAQEDKLGNRLACASSMATDGQWVYILGRLYGNDAPTRAGVWKDLKPERFLLRPDSEFYARDISVSSGVTYLGGSSKNIYVSPDNDIPCFSKNKQKFNFPFPENRFKRGYIESIYVRP
jgi:hypothetical protein